MVAMLYRYALYMGFDTSVTAPSDTDTANVSAWALTAYQWALGANMVNWDPHGKLDPAGGVARALSAVVLERFSQIYGPRAIVIEEHLLHAQTLEELK
ncbi:MAG: hypothetical protein FWG43_04225, partial [Clostridiales bacterium]|nr:hypothetical protein [Clostridiales bacterium]